MLTEHPAVAECLVLGIDHPDLGQEVVAVVVTSTPTAEQDTSRLERELAEYAAGELPWAVEIGETVEVVDWLGPVSMVSREASADEVSYSLVEWLPPEDIAKAFKKRSLPKPVGRAPHQPRKR